MRKVVTFVALVFIGVIPAIALHELLHAVTSYLLTGSVVTCANGTPFAISGSMVQTCVPNGMYRGFDVLAPAITSIVGVVLLWYGSRTERLWIMAMGIITWLANALVAVGVAEIPRDLHMSIEVFGMVAYAPGILALALGAVTIRAINWNKHLSFLF